MPQAKRASRGKRPSKAVSVLGIAGVSLAASTGGSPADMLSASLAAPTAGSATDTLWRNTAPFQVPTLDEEEISDVSLATFHLFDKEDIGNPRSGIQLAAFRGEEAAAADTAAAAAEALWRLSEAAALAVAEAAALAAAEAAALAAAEAAALAGAAAAAAAAVAGAGAGAAAAACRGEVAASARVERLAGNVDGRKAACLGLTGSLRQGILFAALPRRCARASRRAKNGRSWRPECSESACTDLMTGDHGNTFTQHNGKDVPQFAPNFTVYVLPPDVVCLYSEDRKFLLHGELYCALAYAIGKGGRSFRELVRDLEQDFPSDKIHEALKRLVDRRYVLPASSASNGAAAAYWASLGLSPETAEQNLQKCRVRIQSIDVQGETELGAALSGLGVRVVKRSPDLTVTLVNDYLEARLAELNRQHLSDRTPLGARPTLRHFSPGGAGVQTGAERLLDVSCRADEKEPGGQGAPRPQTGPLRRRFASGSTDRRTERHPTCGRRGRESDRHRFSHAIVRSHHQPRPVGLDHREASCGGAARNVRAAAARNCAIPAVRQRRSSLAQAARSL